MKQTKTIKEGKIMDFVALGEALEKMEKVLLTYERPEQDFILMCLRSRFNQKERDMRMADAVGNIPLGGLFGRIKKTMGGEED